jgi:hypothetical protein
MYRCTRWTAVTLAALVASFALACNTAEAQQTREFEVEGGGTAPKGLPLPGAPPGSHWAKGEGTFLHKYHGEGAVQINPDFTVDPKTGNISGTFESAVPFVFTGKDGDKLACTYGDPKFGPQGTYELIYLGGKPPGIGGTYQAFFVADFIPYDPDCTGKVKGVTGGWTMYAMTEPFVLGSTDPVEYTWKGEGSLTFPDK